MRERERDGRWWLGDDEESDRDSELVSMSTHLSAAALSSLPPQARVLSHTLFCPNSRPAPSLPRPLSHKSVLAIGSLSASWRPRQASRFSAWTRRKTKKIRVRSDAASESRGIVRWPGSGGGESRGPGTGLGGRTSEVKFSGRFEAHVGDPSGRVYWHRDPARRHLHAPSLSRALYSTRPPSPSHAPSHRAPRSLSLTPPSGKGMLVRKHVNCSPSLHHPCPGRIWGLLAHPAFTSRSHLTCSPLPLLSARQRAASLPDCPPPRWPLVPRPAQPRKTRMT